MRASSLAAAVLLALGAVRAAAADATVSFDVDSRVELASVVLMLADPAAFRSRRPAGLDAYAASAEAAFSAFSGHPAVARVAGLRKRGVPPSALARAVLSPAGGDALLDDLRDFEKASAFPAFFAAHRPDHQAFREAARRESLHAISPESALAYMGLPFSGEHRFILAPLLPDDAGDEALGVRAGTPADGTIRFGFDTFEGSVAAVLCRAAADWVRAPSGGIPAHIAAAVGLRVLARDLGERVYLAALRRHVSPSLPRLEAVSERLKEYESDRSRYPTLSSFSPRLEALAALRLEQASLAAHGGERAAALALLAEVRAQNPDLETRRRMIFLYQDLKEEAQAKSLADELLASSPGNCAVQLDHAALAAKAGDRAAALVFLAEAAKRAPGEQDRRRMAGLYLELKEYGPARAALDLLIESEPRDARLRLDRAAVAVKTGDRATALRLIAEAAALRPGANERRRMVFLHQDLKNYGPAQVLLDELIAESPADAVLRVDRADAAAAAGDREAALRNLAEARKLPLDLDVRRRMAFLYQSLKAPEQGRDILNELPPGERRDARLLLDQATLAARDGERETALKRLAEAREQSPSFEERLRMAETYRALRENRRAQDLLDGLVAAAPREPRPRIELAALAALDGDRAAALRSLDEARTLNPDADDRRRMALLHQDLKDYSHALDLLSGLVREQPENAALLGDLGLCEYLNGSPLAAVEHLRAAVKLNSSSLAAVITLGSIYDAQRRYDQELALYDAVPPADGEPELRVLLLRSRQEALARARGSSALR